MSTFKILDYNYIFDESVLLEASTADAAFPVTNLRKFNRSKVWRTTSVAAQTLHVDLYTREPIDCAILLFDPEADFTFHEAADIRVKANQVNNFSSPLVNVSMSIDPQRGVIKYLWSSPIEYRHFQFYLDDPYNGFGYFEISKVFLGLATQLNQMPEIGFREECDDRSRIISNDYGDEYSDTFPNRGARSFSWKALTEADKNTMRNIYTRNGNVKPILTALDSEAGMFSNANDYIFYGYLDGKFSAPQTFYTFFDHEMKLREAM